MPGDYSVRLRVDQASPLTQQFRIAPDPRAPHVTAADLQAQFDLAMQVRNRTSEANDAVVRIRDVKAQIDDRVTKRNDREAGRCRAQPEAEALRQSRKSYTRCATRAARTRSNYPIKLNNKLAHCWVRSKVSKAGPTAQSYEVFKELSARLDQQLNWLNTIFTRGCTEVQHRLAAWTRAH